MQVGYATECVHLLSSCWIARLLFLLCASTLALSALPVRLSSPLLSLLSSSLLSSPASPTCRWINGQHLRSLSDEEVHSLVVQQWRSSGLLGEDTGSGASSDVLTVGCRAAVGDGRVGGKMVIGKGSLSGASQVGEALLGITREASLSLIQQNVTFFFVHR